MLGFRVALGIGLPQSRRSCRAGAVPTPDRRSESRLRSATGRKGPGAGPGLDFGLSDVTALLGSRLQSRSRRVGVTEQTESEQTESEQTESEQTEQTLKSASLLPLL